MPDCTMLRTKKNTLFRMSRARCGYERAEDWVHTSFKVLVCTCWFVLSWLSILGMAFCLCLFLSSLLWIPCRYHRKSCIYVSTLFCDMYVASVSKTGGSQVFLGVQYSQVEVEVAVFVVPVCMSCLGVGERFSSCFVTFIKRVSVWTFNVSNSF